MYSEKFIFVRHLCTSMNLPTHILVGTSYATTEKFVKEIEMEVLFQRILCSLNLSGEFIAFAGDKEEMEGAP